MVISNDLTGVIVRQSQNMGGENFICQNCKNYKGGCVCTMGVFIAFERANLSGCVYHQSGRKCPHCGRIA